MSKGVIIYGMHRSGTSLIANWFVRSGFSLGSGKIMAAAEDNPQGFCEREDVVALNDSILFDNGIAWSDPICELPNFSLSDAARTGINRIAEDLRKYDYWVLKDPRMNFLFSNWESVLKNQVRIIVMRNPISVAQSLKTRNDMPIGYGCKLWASYNNAIAGLYEKTNTYVLFYEDVLEDPSQEFVRLAEFLKQHGMHPNFIEGCEIVDAKLNHSKIIENLDNSVAQDMIEQYERFRKILNYVPITYDPEPLEVIHLIRSNLKGQYYRRLSENQHIALEYERKKNSILSEDLARYDGIARSAALYLASTVGRIAKFINSVALFIRFGQKGDSAIEYIERSLIEMNMISPPSTFRDRLALLKPHIKLAVTHPRLLLRKINRKNAGQLYRILLKGDGFLPMLGAKYDPIQLSLTEIGTHDIDEIEFKPCANPVVSIVIPVFNHLDDTLRCLASIQITSGEYPFEVIITDDQSTDGSFRKIEQIKGLKVVQVTKNCGFVENCNYGAQFTRGRYIVFLNNDTEVQSGWLDALVNTIESNSDIGVVGSKLVYPNGKLQEAGGIIFSDGNGWNYGRNDHPGRPEYNFMRYVDYVSGAALLTSKKLWDELGGFDSSFAPAYYEDTDYCFAVRDKGYRVCFEPNSVIVHYEGVSNGTDEYGEGLKQYQRVNKEKFSSKWNDILLEKHFKGAGDLNRARFRGYNYRILIFDHYVPMHDKDAGSRSTRKYIEAFIDLGYQVTFVGENATPFQPYTHELQKLGVEVLYGQFHSRGLRAWFEENLKFFDVLYTHRPHISHKFISLFSDQKKRYGFKWIYFGHDLHYLRAQRDFDAGVAKINESQIWKEKEMELITNCDVSFFPSNVECELMRLDCPNSEIKQLPLMSYESSVTRVEGASSSKQLIFVGGFGHPPNLAGLEWFLDYSWPLIIDKVPDAKLHVIGSNMPNSLGERNDENVLFLGAVSDDELLFKYRSSACAVVPLLSGAGIKGKVLEAMSIGVPVWSTGVGAEGINFHQEQWVTVSDDVEQIVTDICALLLDENKNIEVGIASKRYIQKYYSQAKINEVIKENFVNN